MTAGEPERARALLVGLLVFYAAGYTALAVAGASFFIFKSMLVPAFTLYGVMCGTPARFARDWLPFLSGTVLFDALRGGVYSLVLAGHRPVYADYVIALETWIAGTPAASVPLQDALQAVWLDRVMVGVHGTHFLFFLFFGLVLWHARRDAFPRYVIGMVGLMLLGLLGYLVVPTMPPWLAAERGLLPPVDHVVSGVYAFYVPELYGAFDTNPVAAMPSLHAAFPILCALVAWRAFPRGVALAVGAYALVVGVAAVYLGEHYLVDVLAGGLLAAATHAVADRLPLPGRSLRPGTAVALSLVIVALALAVARLSGQG